MSVFKKTLLKLRHVSLLIDFTFVPLTVLSLIWFRLVKFLGVAHFPLTRKLFYKIGASPVVDHYYEPLFNPAQLSKPLHSKRSLSGIDFNTEAQIKLIRQFHYQQELNRYPTNQPAEAHESVFYYNNGSFPSGDAEFYYSLIRHLKPEKVIEIGSGFSTLIALEAIRGNNSPCTLTCIEPFEFSWLEKLGVEVIREKVELQSLAIFDQLGENDILFIDSSHVIRPQGDVVWEILEILPSLQQGVFIHFHDIFTPHDYPMQWLKDDFRLWNEQYMLEAFLSFNNSFEVIGALHYLNLHHREVLNRAFPVMAQDKQRTPGSFWLRKTN